MDLRGLAELAGEMAARSRPDTPDSDPDGEFDDRSVRLETTFGGAGVMSGDLTPECAAVVIEVLDALSAPAGAEDTRTYAQRYHDALHEAMRRLGFCIMMDSWTTHRQTGRKPSSGQACTRASEPDLRRGGVGPTQVERGTDDAARRAGAPKRHSRSSARNPAAAMGWSRARRWPASDRVSGRGRRRGSAAGGRASSRRCLPRSSSVPPRSAQSVCHSAWIVAQAPVSTPVIGREGLLRLVEWVGRLRARDPGGGEAARASSPDDGADDGFGGGTVDVVSGGNPERRSGIAEHAPGAAGGLAHAGGGGGRG